MTATAASHPAPAAGLPSANALSAGGFHFPSQPRILVVDDQPLHIQMLYRSLAPACQVFMAQSGAQALKLCAERQPDLVLLDVEMPDADGFEVLERLKAQPETRDIPVVFVTAHTTPEVETRCLEAGAVDFISKPINPSVVRARVNTQLKLKFQSDLLREMVFLDGLTGAYNRRYFDQRLEAEFARARRNATPLSLIMFDLDSFKAYNDFRGHQAGDDALRAVVARVKAALQRPDDILARYGGEEFGCLLPDTPFDAAMQLAERLRQVVLDAALPHGKSAAAEVVSISLGVSTWNPPPPPGVSDGAAPNQAPNLPSNQPLPTSTDLLRLSDEQLYLAKNSGRNRVCGLALA